MNVPLNYVLLALAAVCLVTASLLEAAFAPVVVMFGGLFVIIAVSLTSQRSPG